MGAAIARALGAFAARPRLLGSALVGASIGLLSPGALSNRILIGWDSGTALCLVLLAAMMARSEHEDMQRRADQEDAGAVIVLVLMMAGSVMSLVAIVLIFCIFYMIVMEKTRDIGIIKSVGATSTGVASIFLGYGLVIGIIGAGVGLLISFVLIHWINEIHAFLGWMFHIQIWNPEVYLFDQIPNTMNPHEVIIICSIAVLSSVLGALVPAIRAASLHPVQALRWE